MDDEIAGWRQELKDLEEAISEDPPLLTGVELSQFSSPLWPWFAKTAINSNRQNEPGATPPMAELDPVPRCVEIHQSDEKRPRAVLDGWRCDLCGEIVTAQERSLVPPEKCSRCSSSNMTSMEVWAARRPPLGLWTR
jgi:hypothetical protein